MWGGCNNNAFSCSHTKIHQLCCTRAKRQANPMLFEPDTLGASGAALKPAASLFTLLFFIIVSFVTDIGPASHPSPAPALPVLAQVTSNYAIFAPAAHREIITNSSQ